MDFWPPHLEGCICEHHRVFNLDEVAVWHSFARKGFVRLFGQFFAGLLTLRFHLGCVLFGTVLLSGKATCGFLPPCFEECIYKQHRVLIIFSFILFISAVLIRHYSRGVYANTWIQFINHMGKKDEGEGHKSAQEHVKCTSNVTVGWRVPFGRFALKRYIWLFGQSAAVLQALTNATFPS